MASPTSLDPPRPVLDVRGLTVTFGRGEGATVAVDAVDLVVLPRQTVGLVGESGSGKSTLARATMALLPEAARVEGQVDLDGQQVVGLGQRQLRALRGRQVALIPQEPMSALNPVMTIGSQLVEAIRTHDRIPRREARARAVDLLRRVGIPEPALRMKQYPHELSGGMRQRVMIAMAIANHPVLLIADEPTTALDVTIQAQVLALLGELQRELGMSMLLVSHDLSVIAEAADRVVVLYAGRIAEEGTVAQVLGSPQHPYTIGLLGALPAVEGEQRDQLVSIPGSAAVRTASDRGCAFRSRCALAVEQCAVDPVPVEVDPGHRVRCWVTAPPASLRPQTTEVHG